MSTIFSYFFIFNEKFAGKIPIVAYLNFETALGIASSLSNVLQNFVNQEQLVLDSNHVLRGQCTKMVNSSIFQNFLEGSVSVSKWIPFYNCLPFKIRLSHFPVYVSPVMFQALNEKRRLSKFV